MNGRLRLSRAHRFAARYRRWFAAGLAGVTVLSVVRVLAPAEPPTVPVVVATREVTAGSILADSDVHVVALPASAVPPTAKRSESEVLGHTVTGPVGAGEVITATRLVGPDLIAGFGEDRVAAPVRMADAEAVRLLHVGDRIEVYAPAAAGSRASAVVRTAPVVTLPDYGADPAPTSGALVVVAVLPDEAARLAQESSRAPLSFTILG